MILDVRFRVATLMTSRFPNASWLIWLHARAADFFDEQATGRQRGVAKHFAIHAKTRAAREQTVLRIDFEQLRSGSRGLAIGRR